MQSAKYTQVTFSFNILERLSYVISFAICAVYLHIVFLFPLFCFVVIFLAMFIPVHPMRAIQLPIINYEHCGTD